MLPGNVFFNLPVNLLVQSRIFFSQFLHPCFEAATRLRIALRKNAK
jgi:hypothetical protein